MNLRKQLLTNNPCYIAARGLIPLGVMVHSTGANNPRLSRYVQPDDGLLGDNPNNNDWNQRTLNVCVHAFIGKLADGTIATYQTLPWTMRGWHSGKGLVGSANNTHISFEICEGNLDDADYFKSVYQEAVEFTAYLCKLYGFNPTLPGTVICHSEGHSKGIASGHSDVMHWFPKHGKSMDTFRRDVANLLKGEKDMTREQTIEIAQEVVKDSNVMYAKFMDLPDWGKPTVEKLMRNGAIKGPDINMSYDLLRTLVINDRMGLYNKGG